MRDPRTARAKQKQQQPKRRQQQPANALPDPERLRFARSDHELRLFRWARPGARRLLLVHGIGMGHSVYDRFVEEIGDECEVVCVDLPGFGDSPEPAEALSIEQTAELLADGIRELGLGPLTAVGHSMGAQVVAELAAAHPELVDSLVLIAPTVNRHERTARRQAARMLQDFSHNSPVVLGKGLVAYVRTGPLWFVRKLRPTLAHRIEDCLPRIHLPALVLRGEEDPVCPNEWARELAALLPDGELRELADRGHEALISSGEPVARIVADWVAEHPGRTGGGSPLPAGG